ncbi:MAG TPA: TIGR00730 family Rossman fold protein [Desulfatiglandales bacterium]|nr:TIGR00730 family Rossman fold protein [Desulfatiglandales bacterium]
MEIHFKGDNGPVDEAIHDLIEVVGGIRRPGIVREMILASLKAGQEDDGRVDLKLMNTSLKEMRFTAKAFSAYRHFKKVTVFGSARTRPDETAYEMARLLGQKLSEAGYMVITGGGPGIMQAVHEGAGPEYSFGVNIRLPSEQRSNPVIEGTLRNISYKYFFNRKVAFLKESDAIVLFPGGFGTLDEAMETLTLVQTGKRNPVPLVLMDEPGGSYWIRWIDFVKDTLLARGYISQSDLTLFERVDSAEDAVQRINHFYSRYHSLRYVDDRLVIRLTSGIEQRKAEDLRGRFSDTLRPDGEMYLSGPLPEEIDEPEIGHLPRLILNFKRDDFGRLRELIDAINND